MARFKGGREESEMNKMTGKCTVQQFWAEVAHFGWGTRTTDYKAIEREMLERYDDEFLTSFRDVYDEMEGKLLARVEKWETENGESCECGDDGFGDLLSHCVGLGDQYYDLCTEDPGLVVRRGQKSDFTEKFSYGIPHPAVAPDESLEEAIEKVRAERVESRRNDFEEEPDETDEDSILQEALRRILGDRAEMDPRLYGAWAREQLEDLRALADSEFADDFGRDLVLTIKAFEDVAKDDVESMLPKVRDVVRALDRIEKKRERIKEAFAKRIAPLDHFGFWGCKNMVTDIGEKFGDLPSESADG
jgi:hypothetical protein